MCVWRDVGSLLMCLWVFGGFSLGSQIPPRNVLAISFGFVDSIWMRAVSSSDGSFTLGTNLGVLCTQRTPMFGWFGACRERVHSRRETSRRATRVVRRVVGCPAENRSNISLLLLRLLVSLQLQPTTLLPLTRYMRQKVSTATALVPWPQTSY